MHSDRDNSFQDIEKKKKRYVYLAGENVGNFQTDARDSIVVLTHIAWAAIVTSASKVFPTTFTWTWHSWLTFFHYKFNNPREPMGIITNMNKFINPILFIMCLFATACSDENNETEQITPFGLEKNYYEIRLERSATSISITNGSGDINLNIEDENILQAIYSKYNDNKEDNRKGHINLYGMQKGTTTLTIINNVTKDVENVEVKVTDCYLAYGIAESNHPALKANTTLFFINNPAKDSYVFAIDNLHGKLYDRPIAKGSYEFFVTPDPKEQLQGIPSLRLTLHADEEGSVADNGATATSYDFQMMGNNSVFSNIQAYLGVDWEELIDNTHTKSVAPIDMTMTLTVPDTDYQITGVLTTTSIPEHILD